MENQKEVGLFGTVNSDWREILIPLLKCKYFNPIVKDWTEKTQLIEIEKRASCDYILYVLTPKMTGFYAVAELTFDACTTPERIILCILENDDENEFTEAQMKSVNSTKKLIRETGARVFDTLQEVAEFLNYVTSKP